MKHPAPRKIRGFSHRKFGTNDVELFTKILEKSELTESDAERIGHEIKSRINKRFTR